MIENLSTIKIIVIDDDGDLCDALGSMLKTVGFHVGTFCSAEEYLAHPERNMADCLILDVRLPGMSGIQLQNVLRDSGDQVPIVFLTAHGDATIQEKVMKAGARAFLSKPVRRDVLLERVWNAVALSSS